VVQGCIINFNNIGSYFSGTGKGGTSIWNKKFEDEFHDNLKVHSKHISAIIMAFYSIMPEA